MKGEDFLSMLIFVVADLLVISIFFPGICYLSATLNHLRKDMYLISTRPYGINSTFIYKTSSLLLYLPLFSW